MAQQFEHWVRLGMRLEMGLTAGQMLALLASSPALPALPVMRHADALPQGRAAKAARQTIDMQGERRRSGALLRQARLEADVAAGRSDAGSLLTIPERLARRAKLAFPVAAYGGDQAW